MYSFERQPGHQQRQQQQQYRNQQDQLPQIQKSTHVQYECLRKRAMECRVMLLKSESHVRHNITEWRNSIQKRFLESLKEAEMKTLSELQKLVLGQEKKIAETEEQAEQWIQKGYSSKFRTELTCFEDSVVRFQAEDLFEKIDQSVLCLGGLSLEDVTMPQMTSCRDLSFTSNTQDTIYHEISSLKSFNSNTLRQPEYNYAYNDTERKSVVYDNDDAVYEFESPVPMHDSEKMSPSADTTVTGDPHLYHNTEDDVAGKVSAYYNVDHHDDRHRTPLNAKEDVAGEDMAYYNEDNAVSSMPKAQDRIVSQPSLDVDGDTTQFYSNVQQQDQEYVDKNETYTKLSPTVEQTLHVDQDDAENTTPVYAISSRQRRPSLNSNYLFGGESMSNKTSLEEIRDNKMEKSDGENIATKKTATYNENPSTKITEWKTFHFSCQQTLSGGFRDSCRFAILSGGRLVLLCESEGTLILFDSQYKHVKTQNITCPRAICNVKDDLIAVVQREEHSQTVLLIRAKSNFLVFSEGKTLYFEDSTVEIKYRDCRYFLGCCNFKVHICDENFKNWRIISCGEFSCPMISLDYNHGTNTLYTVSSAGTVTCLKDINTSETSAFQIQGIAICCHDDKAYVLCDQKGKVVELYQDGWLRQRDVVHYKGSNPIDICISSDGAVLIVLFSVGNEVSIENYDVHNNVLPNVGEKDHAGKCNEIK